MRKLGPRQRYLLLELAKGTPYPGKRNDWPKPSVMKPIVSSLILYGLAEWKGDSLRLTPKGFEEASPSSQSAERRIGDAIDVIDSKINEIRRLIKGD